MTAWMKSSTDVEVHKNATDKPILVWKRDKLDEYEFNRVSRFIGMGIHEIPAKNLKIVLDILVPEKT